MGISHPVWVHCVLMRLLVLVLLIFLFEFLEVQMSCQSASISEACKNTCHIMEIESSSMTEVGIANDDCILHGEFKIKRRRILRPIGRPVATSHFVTCRIDPDQLVLSLKR